MTSRSRTGRSRGEAAGCLRCEGRTVVPTLREFLFCFSFFCFGQTDVTAALSNGETTPHYVSVFPRFAYMPLEDPTKNRFTSCASRRLQPKKNRKKLCIRLQNCLHRRRAAYAEALPLSLGNEKKAVFLLHFSRFFRNFAID